MSLLSRFYVKTIVPLVKKITFRVERARSVYKFFILGGRTRAFRTIQVLVGLGCIPQWSTLLRIINN
jgi:hypothetical protein